MGTELISIINTKYCKPAPINIKIETDKGVAYINNEVIFRIHEPSFSLEDRRVIYDVSGNPVFTLSKKIISMHDRWRVFKGQSTNSSDLLFSAKRSTFLIPEKKNIDLNVYLAKNTKESVWDFKVCAGAEKRSCDICAHGSSTLLAKMTKNKEAFEVEVQPNVDYGFIVALLTIVDEIKHTESSSTNYNDEVKVAEAALNTISVGANTYNNNNVVTTLDDDTNGESDDW
ncbi:protein LURP-one-related 10-like [Arachis stenosperma]|uniref:protein LURP-one-related 10-like n=1 Tax=Arachis stenosperma TaxID=217475 RepID=UPI0025AC5B5C|nr:protein LURP-one-related 10-like [Arachis stenosperma]